MQKKIKFYIHHNHFENIDLAKRRGVFGAISRFILGIFSVVFNIFYAIGFILLNIIILPSTIIKWLVKLPSHVRTLRHNAGLTEFRRSLGILATLSVIVMVSVFGAELIAAGQTLKGRVLGESDSAITHLGEAKNALQSQDITRAEKSFTSALEHFEKSEQEMHSASLALQSLMELVPQKHDADQLLEAARLITEAGKNGTQAYGLIQNLKVGPQGISGSDSPELLLQQLQNLIEVSTVDIQKATELMNSVSLSIIPQDKQPVFVAARDALGAMKNNLQTLSEGAELLFGIALGQKNILLVFQNNNELRATGGFLGTVGAAQVSNGEINKLDIRSVYDYDGQLEQWILPPQPMYAVNSRWYLRDSNWFADFPSSAERIITMYEKEGGETPDMVMALTPEFVIELLKRTGPISLPQHNTTLTSENFIDTVQTITSITYDKELNQPKQLLADFFPALLQKLGDPAGGGFVALLEVLQNSLSQKDILLYARNNDLQNQIQSFNWGGTVRATDRDYLSVISSNLGGTKTDRYLVKDIIVNSEVAVSGVITNTVTYIVSNPLGRQAGLENTSFIRFLVPHGSKLISSSGFSDVQLPRLEDPKYTVDSTVDQWNQSLSRDVATGTYTGTESGKTMFANWVRVEGGETKTVTIKYELPFYLEGSDRMSILLQKQPGSLNTEVSYNLIFPNRKSVWQNYSSDGQSEDQLNFEANLTKDLFLGEVITK